MWRSGIALDISSHNLYLRALITAGESRAALAHFERMSAAGGERASPPSTDAW